MSNIKMLKKGWVRGLTASLALATASGAQAQQVGQLLWEDNFNNLDTNTWTTDIGDGCDQGLCGWGNQELQWYAQNNVTIEGIPNEPGNNGLVLTARNEQVNSYGFTSGKIQSSNKVSIQYGMIEVRMLVTDVGTGLWPAAWLLGTSTATWPAKGEIDMMEMGQSVASRAGAGFPNAPINNYTGSNIIFYTEDACSSGNPTCAASIAFQNDNAHVSSTPLTNRFVTYRTYWTDTTIRFTIEDNGVEYDMFDAPFTITEESDEFNAPFYLLLNLAVGGNFTDAAVNGQVNAPLPGKMIVDYVRVYELDGQGEVLVGNTTNPEAGTFGVFTDNSPTNNKLEPGVSSDIYVWNQVSVTEGSLAPFEGDNVIAWQYSPNQWFGGGIQTRQAKDMSNFRDGDLRFRIRIPGNVGFRVGIADTFTNENWINFPANQNQYGMVRDGEWAEVVIPVADLVGDLIALQSVKNHFNIASIAGQEPNFGFQMAIDDIIWTGGGAVAPNPTDIDFTDLVGSVSAQFDDSPGSETINELFDNNVNTKYLTFNSNAWVQYNIADGAYIATKYRITSGNDAPQRDPRDWSLQGSTNGIDWVTIDSRTGQDFPERRQTREFTFSNNVGYSQYRLNMVNNSGTILQLSELEILGEPTPVVDEIDFTDLAGIVSSQFSDADSPANERAPNAFDNNVNSKYLTFNPDSYLQFQVGSGAYVLKNYTITSANDAPQRDPLNWTVLGSNNGVNWQTIDSRSGEDFPNRFQTRGFNVNNNDAFEYFRIQMSNNSGTLIQLAEIELFGPATPVVVDGDGDGDSDGVLDSVDQCPNTPTGRAVDAAGCALPLDSDNDGVNDDADQCPNTPAGVDVDASGCEVAQSAEGVEQINASTVVFFVNSNAWADVHYRLNGGPQQNLRMVNTNGRNEYVLNGLSSGDQVSYWFTYLQDNGIVIDTSTEVYTLSGGGNTNPPPADSDNDGVPDSSDQCPNTSANTVVNSVGCAVISTPLVLIQAEDYVAFNDSDAGNNGGEYRNDDVDIENTSDTGGGFNVGWTEDGEWLEYNVTLGAGTYNVSARVASDIGGGAFDLSMNGSVFASTNVDNTGGWQSFTTVNLGQLIVSSQGEQTIRMTASSGGFNINWIQLSTGAVIDTDSDNDGVPNASDQCPNTPNGVSVDATGCVISLGAITPLFNGSTPLEQAISFDRGDALVTRFADRGRDRHAKEDQFQIYDHYLSKYWVHRTAQFQFVDYVAKGGNTIEITFITEWKLGAREFRAFYRGLGTVAEYHGNYFGGGAVVELDNGSYDFNFNKVSDNGNQYRYRVIVEDYRPLNWNPAVRQPLQVGQRMEFEASQFLDAPPEGRANYYGTTYLYIVGEGLVPWKTVGTFGDLASEREDSYPIAREGWLGGNTTLPYNYTNEPDNHFMQMATNLSNVNGQNFVEGRRLHHSSFLNGQHDERNGENGVFNEVVGKVGTHYVNESCAGCHVRNGRATAADVGESLDKWVFKIGDVNGNPDAQRGSILQPRNVGINAADGEGNVSIANWVENNGLRSPEYQFTGPRPARFSGRIAPNIIGMGLLEAIPESDILAREDTNDANGDGISGKANRVQDPETGETRLGRFGWKAAAFSIEHQIAVAFNGDMGVMTNMLPNPDCGSAQTNCGSSGSEVSDADVEKLTKYIALLGVRAQRDLDNPAVQRGKQVFNDIGCASCHTPEQQTSAFHPLAELRSQTFYPYTDMLLHDMGPGLADNLGEGQASGSEWRTAPLWGTGLSPCVTGGVRNDTGAQGDEYCTPERSYLHDGRSRTVEEAILWHGGESQQSKVRFESLSQNDKNALLTFLDSL